MNSESRPAVRDALAGDARPPSQADARLPHVSIVMAAYNPGPFLEETVQSVIAQTYRDWELIIVDDGSTQDISAVARMHPAIVYLRQENCGQSAARNVAVLRARGDLIAFLDQDDLWAPTKLQEQVQAMEAAPGIGLSYTNFQRIDARGSRLGDGFAGGAETYLQLLLGCCICISTTMVRRRALASAGLFDPFYTGLQDYDLWLKIARCHKLQYLPAELASYRQHDSNLSHRYVTLFDEIRWLFREHIKLAMTRGDRDAERCARRGLARARLIYGSQAFDQCRTSLRRHEIKAFSRHIFHAARLAPAFVVRSIFSYLRCLLRRDGRPPLLPGGLETCHH
jgi:glycosyltransferase involved in cell wall biosynthesis